MPWFLIPLAYLLGSLSPAYWAGRCKGIDLRRHGSGNLGATNAGRVLGGKWFAIVFLADVLKGLGPVLAAQALPIDEAQRGWLLITTAAAAVLGHVFTCFHGFKGGKAVATSLGVVLALVPVIAGITFAVWLLAWSLLVWWRGVAKSAAVGPASSLAAAAVPVIRFTVTEAPLSTANAPVTGFLCLLAVLVVVRHVANLRAFFAAKPASTAEAAKPASPAEAAKPASPAEATKPASPAEAVPSGTPSAF